MDLDRRRWEEYTRAKEELHRTHIPKRARVIEGVKKAARLNCIHHLPQQIPYEDVPHPPKYCRYASTSRLSPPANWRDVRPQTY